MTYYEELGIPSGASVDEIRQAYKALARLLHPDGQTDPKLRALAECQMKRLSEMVAILSNPQKRQQYDGEQARGERPVVNMDWAPPRRAPVRPLFSTPGWMRWAVQNWFGVLLGMVAVTMAAWYFATPDASGVGKAKEAVATVAAGQAEAAAPVPRKQKAATPERTAAAMDDPPPELPPEVESARAEETNVAALKETLPAAPVAGSQTAGGLPVAAKPEPSLPVVARNESSFAGNWLYAPLERETAAPGQYPASYVELVLLEEKGTLVGHYRSRHKIPDRAISPEVLLRVQGKPGAEKSTKLEWTSADGARGEMELTLSAPNLLNVRWWTTELGWTTEFEHRNALSSGTAVLVRQMTR